MRRLVFIIIVAALVLFGLHRYTQKHTGGRRTSERYTPASGPKIDLENVRVLAALDAEYTKLIDAIVPSVVSVTSRGLSRPNFPFEMPPLFRRGFGAPRVKTSLGSGVIVSREGHILTNHHVIAGMQRIQVQLTDGRLESADLIGSDEATDIAVLKVNTRNVEPLPLGDSDRVRVGQLVFAIGNPFGLQETVTQGIISAKGRRTMMDSDVEFLQTDAAVNQGNSGGPLLNLQGEIIGINTAIYSETGGWLGISFAIPSNTARRALESVIKTGRVVRAYLGVIMAELTPEIARELGAPDTSGALVRHVMGGSPAEKAEIQSGDIIRKFNGRKIEDMRALRSRVADVDVGAKVEILLLRNGREQTVSAEIAEAPSEALMQPPPAPQPADPGATPDRKARSNVLSSIQVGEIPSARRDRQTQDAEGVVVLQVQPNSAAADKLLPGDIIEEINQRRIETVQDFEEIAQTLSPEDKALLYIVRGRTRAFVVLSP